MDDAQRDAYEERREDERRQEREREEAYRDELMAEDSRRLARYDEMFSLLKEAANDGWFSNKDLHDRLQTFLAAEGKVAG